MTGEIAPELGINPSGAEVIKGLDPLPPAEQDFDPWLIRTRALLQDAEERRKVMATEEAKTNRASRLTCHEALLTILMAKAERLVKALQSSCPSARYSLWRKLNAVSKEIERVLSQISAVMAS